MRYLKELLKLRGPSGFEKEVRNYVLDSIKGKVDSIYLDSMGNIIAEKKGKSDFRIMMAAHMDEVGFIVYRIEPGGFARFDLLGSWDERIIPGTTVEFLDGTIGVVGAPPPHIQSKEDAAKPYKLEKLFIDTGLNESELAARGITVGVPVVPYCRPVEQGSKIISRALDDRIGVAVLLNCIEHWVGKTPESTLVFSFTTQEEAGTRGAKAAVDNARCCAAFIFEGTVAGDMPGIAPEKCPTLHGKGPSFTIMDGGMIANTEMLDFMKSVASESSIPYQFRLPRKMGGTDAGAIHTSGGGTACGVVSVSCRYIHSGASIADIGDFENSKRMAVALSERINEAEALEYGFIARYI